MADETTVDDVRVVADETTVGEACVAATVGDTWVVADETIRVGDETWWLQWVKVWWLMKWAKVWKVRL